jgi:hypothetical protein
MNLNLDSLKDEIQQYLDREGFLTFHGWAPPLSPAREARWNTEVYNDYRDFLKLAREAGVRIIAFHTSQFSAESVDEARDQMEGADLSREETRRFERRLRELREYDGFTHEIELSFDYGGRTYVFELETEWYESFEDLMDELELSGTGDDDDDEEEGPMDSGFFSNN